MQNKGVRHRFSAVDFKLEVTETSLGKFRTVIRSIAAAIFLGAVGSGLWEKVLSPFLAWASTETVALVSRISAGYEDSIYQRAARDVTDLYAIKIVLLIVLICGLVLVIWAIMRIVASRTSSPFLQGVLHGFLSGNGLAIGLALLMVTFFSLAKVDAASRIKERSLRTMEILRPAVGEVEYTRLRARYYSINSRADFLAFKQESLSHSNRLGIKNPLDDAD